MKMTRRFFLRSTGALALYCGLAPLELLAETGVEAKKVKKGKTLVVIFLRGGMDGLNMIVPFNDPFYYKLRNSIAIPKPGQKNGAIDLNGFFGLHPRARSLKPIFDSGDMVALHAVGYAHNTRSHFEEQDVWETGVIGNTINSDGWLNRHLLTSEGNGPIRAVAIGNSLPRILRGKSPAYAIRGLDDLTLPGNDDGQMAAALEHAYREGLQDSKKDASDLLAETGKETLDAVKILNKIAAQPYVAKALYPNTPLAKRLKEAARLIKSNIGVEVVEIDYGGWDTHRNQGGINGPYGNLVQGLSDALAAFYRDLEKQMDDVLVLTLSDFGRTAAQNGSGGTDHGWANCMFAMGGTVSEAKSHSKVISKWPGLAPEQLHQKRDLLHTIDFRDVLAETVQNHLGNQQLKKILPQHKFTSLGFLDS